MTTLPFLVQYGRTAFVGPFTAGRGVAAGRGDRVVIRSPRGVELGTVLCELGGSGASAVDPAAGGEILRLATPDDETEATRRDATLSDLLTAAEERAHAADLPLAFLDAEMTLDGTTALLHAAPWGPCDADELLAGLSARFGLAVRLMDISRTPVAVDPPEQAHTCGKPDCGSGAGGCSSCGTGGGCSTGSCSRGTVKSADDLTAYFADLRGRMEAAAARTPLN